jgi:hypothetical protein
MSILRKSPLFLLFIITSFMPSSVSAVYGRYGVSTYYNPYGQDFIHELAREYRQAQIRYKNEEDESENKKKLKDELDAAKKAYEDELKQSGSAAFLVAKGLAGEDGIHLNSDTIKNNMLEGIRQGLTIRASKEVGNIFSKKVSGTLEHLLGGMWDFTFGKISDVWERFCNFLFYGGNKSFTTEELGSLQQIIKDSLEELEQLIKQSLRDSSRGHDMTLRQLDTQSQVLSSEVILQLKKDLKNKEKELEETKKTFENSSPQLLQTIELLAAEISSTKKEPVQGVSITPMNETLQETNATTFTSEDSQVILPKEETLEEKEAKLERARCLLAHHKTQMKNKVNSLTEEIDQIKEILEQQASSEIEKLNVWFELISGYAEQYHRFVIEIESRKKHYDEESMEVFYAVQIQERLLFIREILLRSKSRRELETILDSNSVIVTTVKKNVDNLFKRLIELVRPRTYSTINGDSKKTSNDRLHERSDCPDHFPHHF